MRIPSLITACLLAGASLSACQTQSAKETPAGTQARLPNEIPSDAPKLPSDYRRLLAEYALNGYMKDGTGHPEISSPSYHRSLWGSSVQVIVRFPVRAAASTQYSFLINPNGPDRTRCYGITVDRSGAGIAQMRSGNGYAGLADAERCGGALTFSPFKELESYAERMKACGSKDKSQCLPQPELKPGQVVTQFL